MQGGTQSALSLCRRAPLVCLYACDDCASKPPTLVPFPCDSHHHDWYSAVFRIDRFTLRPLCVHVCWKGIRGAH